MGEPQNKPFLFPKFLLFVVNITSKNAVVYGEFLEEKIQKKSEYISIKK